MFLPPEHGLLFLRRDLYFLKDGADESAEKDETNE
jgi:hypothetical protein